MSNDDKRELATNRLLDLLRSQQADIGKKAEPQEKKDDIDTPDVETESEKNLDKTFSSNILIPDPSGKKTEIQSDKKISEETPTLKGKDPEEHLSEKPEPELTSTDSTSSESIRTTTKLEDSPGLNALRRKIGLLKNQDQEDATDDQPADIFKEPEIPKRKTDESGEHPKVNDLLKTVKKIPKGKDPDTEIEKKVSLSDSTPLKKEKPLTEFFKRGSDTAENSKEKEEVKSKVGPQNLLSKSGPKSIEKPIEDFDHSPKKEKPLKDFFKRGTDLEERDEKEDDQVKLSAGLLKSEGKPEKPEIQVKVEKKEEPVKDEESREEVVTEIPDEGTGDEDVQGKIESEEKKSLLTPTTKLKEENAEEDKEIIPDSTQESDSIIEKTKKKKSLISKLFSRKKSSKESKAVPEDVLKDSDADTGDDRISDTSDELTEEVIPEAFDESLLNFLDDHEIKSAKTNYIASIIQRFDESQQRISIVADEQSLLLLLITYSMTGVTVIKYKYYMLPYKLPKRIISNLDELLGYILSHEITEKQKKTLYGTYFSTKMLSKTQVLHSPELSRKELKDLVDWNSQKNLPFPADQSISNWEITKSGSKTKKHEVIIGVLDSKSINPVYNLFTRHNIRLRFTSTLPILLWKSFVKNYPDRNNQCNVLINIGEVHTIVLVIQNHKLLFVREIALGTQDFYKSIMQRIETKDKSTIEVDFEMARKITHQYGFPKDAKGFTVGSKVNLYKMAIFQRPVVERISGELGRSLNYFKKQNSELIWEELVFNGIGATLPNLIETLRDNLNIDVSLFNPVRNLKVNYSGMPPIPNHLLPNFAINFSLISEEVKHLNLMPIRIRGDQKNILFSKLAGIAIGIFIPFVAISTFLSGLKIDTYSERINILEMERNNTLSQTKEYYDLKGDIEIIQAYQEFINNDRINSQNKIKLLKILSNSIPEEIKITELRFKKKYPNINSDEPIETFGIRPMHYIELKGFVTSDVSVANIQLANFRVGLQNKSYFKSINVLREDISSSTNGRLLFTMELKY